MNNSYLKAFLLSVCITGIFFCLITYFLSAALPGAILTLAFLIPALGLLLYGFLNNRFPNNTLEKFSLSVSNLTLGICVAMLFFGYLKLYTLVTFFILFALLFYVEYKNKLRFMYRFYRTYVALLLPFFLLCLLIKSQIPLTFNPTESLKLNIFYLPIEVYFYFMGILLMAVYLFELFKSKAINTNE